jgi:hypothetical protein
MRNEFRSAREGAFGSTVVVFACAASAGAHAGLVPAHLQEEPRLGVAFLVAVALLLSALIAVSLRPDRRVLAGAALVLFGLALAYLATRTIGIPVLDPEREAVDTVGVLTTSIEIAGVAFALWLTQPLGRVARPVHIQEVSR